MFLTSRLMKLNYYQYSKNPLYRSALLITMSSAINSGCCFLFWVLAARLYSIEDVGISTALISSLNMIIILSRFGFDVSLIRFYPTYDKNKVFNSAFAVTTISSAIIGIAFVLLVNLISPQLALIAEPFYSTIFILSCVLNSMLLIVGNVFIVNRKNSHYLFQYLLLISKLPFIVLLNSFGNMGIFISYTLAMLIADLLSFRLLKESLTMFSLRIDNNFVRDSLSFSLWNYLSTVFSAMPTLIMPILILNLLGPADAAKYYIAFGAVANIVLIIPSSLSTSLFIEGSHGMDLKNNAIKSGKVAFSILIPIVLFFSIFGARILDLLGEDYIDASGLLRILVLSSFLVTIYSFFISIQNVRMKAKGVACLNIVRFILLIGLSYPLILRYGIIGAGYAWIAAYGIIVIGIVGIAKKEKWI